MGRLVKLWKLEESEESVAYAYGPDRESTGRLTIDKKSGDVAGSEPVPGMSARESWFFYGMLAKAKAEKMFRKKDYPDETSMAS